jgi:hypothetical protein
MKIEVTATNKQINAQTINKIPGFILSEFQAEGTYKSM